MNPQEGIQEASQTAGTPAAAGDVADPEDGGLLVTRSRFLVWTAGVALGAVAATLGAVTLPPIVAPAFRDQDTEWTPVGNVDAPEPGQPDLSAGQERSSRPASPGRSQTPTCCPRSRRHRSSCATMARGASRSSTSAVPIWAARSPGARPTESSSAPATGPFLTSAATSWKARRRGLSTATSRRWRQAFCTSAVLRREAREPGGRALRPPDGHRRFGGERRVGAPRLRSPHRRRPR